MHLYLCNLLFQFFQCKMIFSVLSLKLWKQNTYLFYETYKDLKGNFSLAIFFLLIIISY